MTPAIKIAEKAKVYFKLFEYEHDSNAHSFGLEAAEFLAAQYNVIPEQVFKTLVVETSGKELVVAIICVKEKLSMKNLAKAIGVKKAKMATEENVLRSTGYVLGGVSPLGQKNRLKTVIDETAKQFDVVYVSAGKRGLEIALSPKDLIELTNAKVANIIAV